MKDKLSQMAWTFLACMLAILVYSVLTSCTLTAPRAELLSPVSNAERFAWLEANRDRVPAKVYDAVWLGRVEEGMTVEQAYVAWARHQPYRVWLGTGNGPAYLIHEFKTVGPGEPLRRIVVYEGVVVDYHY